MKKWIPGVIILTIVALWAKSEIASYNTPNIDTLSTKSLPFSSHKIDFNQIDAQPISLTYNIGQLAPSNLKSLRSTLDPIIDHLKDHNYKVIHLTGGFVEEESKINVGGFTNFGAARAGYIKRELAKANIAKSRISISGVELNPNVDQNSMSFELKIDPEIKK